MEKSIFDAVHEYAKEKEVVQYQAWGPNDNDHRNIYQMKALGNIVIRNLSLNKDR